MEKEKDKDLWHIFTSRYAVPLLTASLGFGSSQLLLVQGVRDNVMSSLNHLDNVDKIIAEEKAAVTEERAARVLADTENRVYIALE